MKTIGHLLGIATGLFCLVVNNYRYATQISPVWYILFLALYIAALSANKRHNKRILGVALFFAALTLVIYIYALPKFTYKQAVVELSGIYTEENFVSTLNTKYQKMVPKVNNGSVSYYCYVVETDGKYYFFDQYTGLYGRVTTDPESVL